MIRLHETGVRAVGCWESYPNRVRAGLHQADLAEHFEWEHDEAFVKGLAARGFNLYITQFAKGFGVKTERPYMQRTAELVRLCHRYDIAVGGYIRYTNLMPETMKLEVPDCLDRYAGRTGAGEYARYSRFYWRYIPCPCSQAWLDEYIDKIVEIGVTEVGLDFLAVDGPTLWPEPDACHCARCQQAFVRYLMRKYPDPGQRRRRFGFDNLTHIELPYYGHPANAATPKRINDPVAQDWVLFRCERLTEIYRFIVEAAKRRRPDIWVSGNIKYEPGHNTAWAHSNDLWALHHLPGEMFYTEEPNAPDLKADGTVLSYIATFKKARQFGKRVLTYNRQGPPGFAELTDPEPLARSYAHQLAFAYDAMGCAVQFKTGEFPVRLEPWFRFHAQHRELYRTGEQIADVGVYYSTRSLAFNFREPHLGMLLAQQALIHERVPFNYVFGEDLKGLAAYRAVILSEVECLSDREVSALAEYVRAGGGLILAGRNGTCDELRQPQPRDRLAQPLDLPAETVPSLVSRACGQGRVVRMPALRPAGTADDDGGSGMKRDWVEDVAKGSRFSDAAWRSPANVAELMDRLRWAAQGFSVETDAPPGVVCEYIRQPERGRILVHAVNFDLERDAEAVGIRCRIASKDTPVAVQSPDAVPPRLAPDHAAQGVSFTLHGLHRYAVAVVG